jgi:hypothetical protein
MFRSYFDHELNGKHWYTAMSRGVVVEGMLVCRLCVQVCVCVRVCASVHASIRPFIRACVRGCVVCGIMTRNSRAMLILG